MIRNYNKLVRDNIPQKLSGLNLQFKSKSIDTANLRLICLENKILEELDEFKESGEIEELADLLEVIYAMAELKDCSKRKLERVRRKKRNKYGAFKKGIFLKWVDE